MAAGMMAVMAVTAVASAAGQASAATEAAAAQNRALNIKEKQNQMVYNQKSIDSYSRLIDFLDAQKAAASVTGAAPGSPSFGALAMGAQNQTAKEQQNFQIEKEIGAFSLDNERQNVKRKLKGDLFGLGGQLSQQGMQFYQSAPKGWFK